MRFASIGLRAGCRLLRSSDPPSANRPEAGFTLLETLTALAILAMALVTLFDAQARGLRAASAAESYVEARLLGQALLADAVTRWNASLASRNGQQGRFAWSVRVGAVDAGWAQIKSEKSEWLLHRVQVKVSWDRDREVVLNTLKLGRPSKDE